MLFWRRLQCRFFGHPGVFREWEWKPVTPQWQERQDAWTCIRCHSEFPSIPLGVSSYIVARPVMDANFITHVNEAIEAYGEHAVRIRAGDPTKRQLRPTAS
mgnify:FL=1